MTAQTKVSKAQRACDEWNRKHPVGDEVTVLLDNGVERSTTTRSEAYVSNSGHAVIFLTGVSGYYLLERVGAKSVNAMSDARSSEDGLKPCPFCGAGYTEIRPNVYWTGGRNEILSVEVKHWCEHVTNGVQGSMVTMRAKTEAEAVAKWNGRVS